MCCIIYFYPFSLAPPAPCDFTVYGDVAVWKTCHNLPVTHFEICISVFGEADVIIEVAANMFFFSFSTSISAGAEIKVCFMINSQTVLLYMYIYFGIDSWCQLCWSWSIHISTDKATTTW